MTSRVLNAPSATRAPMDSVLPTLQPITNRQQAVDYLLGRINYERTVHIPYGERTFKLDRMRMLAERLGNPHERLKIIHVTGSKGKGSTSTMIAGMLMACGLRTGLFTSPHLLKLEERIQIDGLPIGEAELVALTNRLAVVVAEMDRLAVKSAAAADIPTFFEMMTALGFLHFAEQQVDAVVLEVGLGGRLDSTNICTPVCSVITSIGLDHTRQLGNTITLIAGEKAGIVKPGVPVVSGATQNDARAVIRARAKQQESPLLEIDRDFFVQARTHAVPSVAVAPLEFDLQLQPGESVCKSLEISQQRLNMLGVHQAANASLALVVARILQGQGWRLPLDRLRAGLETALCPARIEVIGYRPFVVLDTAHTPASIRALIDALTQHTKMPRDLRTLIFAATRGKDASQMLDLIMPWAGKIVLTQYYDNPRSIAAARLADFAQRSAAKCAEPAELSVAPTPEQAWQKAMAIDNEVALVCITGSFFLAAEMDRLVRAWGSSRVKRLGG